jgi:hypothetical protein
MPSELTTLQVARRIADAVESALDGGDCGEPVERNANDALDPPTQAVLRVLHETGSWLCRWDDSAAPSLVELPGVPADTAEPAEDEPTLF